MASVVRRRRKNGKVSWYARYRDGRGKDVWEKCASAKDARARAAEVETLLARTGGAWSPPVKMTVAEYAERWLAERGPAIRERTLHSYRRSFEREILPNFGRIPLAAHRRNRKSENGRGDDRHPRVPAHNPYLPVLFGHHVLR
jgi:integrase-like protein